MERLLLLPTRRGVQAPGCTAAYGVVLTPSSHARECLHGPFCQKCYLRVAQQVLPACTCRALVMDWRTSPWEPPSALQLPSKFDSPQDDLCNDLREEPPLEMPLSRNSSKAMRSDSIDTCSTEAVRVPSIPSLGSMSSITTGGGSEMDNVRTCPVIGCGTDDGARCGIDAGKTLNDSTELGLSSMPPRKREPSTGISIQQMVADAMWTLLNRCMCCAARDKA